MPELFFKGKEYVYNHHLTVPYRPLIADPEKSIGPADLAGNLIIHGDNLHALKSLLPRYAGKVDLIFIDPPYNTGNESWSYNDNVNSPIMREWLRSNPVNVEDMLRHDKWLCMMWPRLTLLRELLSDRGSLWITLDDNEVHRARSVIDEIFGAEAFIASVIWQKNFSPKNTAQFFSEDHDYVLVVAKNRDLWRPNLLERTARMEARYSNPDNDSRGAWTSGDLSARNYYSEGIYSVTCPGGRVIDGPPPGTFWRVSKKKFDALDRDKRIWWGEDQNNMPRLKRFLENVKQGRVPQTLWFYEDVGHTQDAKKTLLEIGVLKSQEDATMTPKPVALIEKVIELGTQPDSLVLDSFAGSGTTGHAVLRANSNDSGSRRFILVESEDYADRITAERVRRVINGYAYVGTQREELLRDKVTWSKLQKSADLLEQVEAIKQREGFSDRPDLAQVPPEKRRFDKVNVKMDDGVLLVEGEKKISKRVEGLGGEFTYCTLGEPIDAEKILSGEQLPDYSSLAAWLFYTATGATLDKSRVKEKEFFIGRAQDRHVWLIYKPDLVFLKSPEAALTLSFAKGLRAKHKDRRHLVFAPAKYLSNKQLLEFGVEFAPLPFVLYREA
ncbi:MAG: site-specific DNA-methyltransferase [Betaproteobacteria bacterium]|nr:site-specific DNA-methyltransferase [Betaproteobacteria bacterium]